MARFFWTMTLYPVPTRCPVCEGATHIERVRCEQCASAVEGAFTLDWVGQLSRDQLSFVRVFLTARGKIKDVEQALGISYPTVVSRLDEVVAAITGSPRSSARAPTPEPPPVNRLEVLDALAQGLIDVDEAERRLKPPR
jgi:hypothetical protein